MSGPEETGRHRMTLRVYRVGADGTVTREYASVVAVGGADMPVPQSLAFPPCRCPRCRPDDGESPRTVLSAREELSARLKAQDALRERHGRLR
ncbi:hypothetical protein ACFYW6_34715 [Streptomyces sp. NPDC002659]|uniref:hypothetical protein n=1 Tax=Streptomyces sp. NPDC002659 TaxID=3364656 RepID=UPI0036AE14FA